ncbi:MAG: hypothetical protein ACHQF3_04330 [Alphaproteobacteria bacterium]
MWQHGVIAGIAAALFVLAGGWPLWAAAATPEELWQSYLDAAVEANVSDDFTSAEALLKAADDVARQRDANGPRAALTRLVLDFVEVELEKRPPEDIISRQGLAPDLAGAETALLPAADSFARLANNYYHRWEDLDPDRDSAAERAKAKLRLREAEICRLVALAMQKKLLLAGDVAIASTMALYGVVLSDEDRLDEAKENYRAALDIWAAADRKNAQLMEGSRRFSLNQGRTAGDAKGGNDPLLVKFFLAQADMTTGYQLRNEKKVLEAARDFKEAEEALLEVIAIYDKDWPDRLATGYRYYQLARLYSWQEGRLRDAEDKFRRALAIYEAVEGKTSDDVATIVERLAAVLRQEQDEDRARALETAYGVKPPASGK